MALIKAGAEVNAKDKDNHSVLIWAAMNNANPQVITTLVKAGADLKIETEAGRLC